MKKRNKIIHEETKKDEDWTNVINFFEQMFKDVNLSQYSKSSP